MIGLAALMICARDVTMSRWLRRIRAEAKRGVAARVERTALAAVRVPSVVITHQLRNNVFVPEF
jgi:hypothetical protein